MHLLEHMLLAIPGSKMKIGDKGFKKNLLFLCLSVQCGQIFLDLISGFVPQFSKLSQTLFKNLG